jgi:hypothetical protein
MLKDGVIEPASTEWDSPVVPVLKPDGSLRFCVDYRKSNAMRIRDTYPLPGMDEFIDSLGDARIFSSLESNCGYWQIPMEPGALDCEGFSGHFPSPYCNESRTRF